MRSVSLIRITAALGLAGCAPSQEFSSAASDPAFLRDEARHDLFEIRLGELAKSYAQLPDVAAYGSRMAEDHRQALAALQPIARKLAVTLPDSLDDDQSSVYELLGRTGGSSFQRQYMDYTLWMTRGELDRLDSEADSKGDPELAAYARSRRSAVAASQLLGREIKIRNFVDLQPPSGTGGG
ncbi:MAG TPA: DUF4142 domain-containing protein [Aliidongia sp.]|nr:DUF4142 domain-containing protein [Aliidongia sp.]